jgi:hypothetical protein
VAAPGPRTRETVVEAEAAPSRVAAEAEAGKTGPHALREPRGGRGSHPACERGKGVKRR